MPQIDRRSTFSLIGLPTKFGEVLLVLALLFLVSPYIPGSDWGVVKIPILSPGPLHIAKILGPIVFVLCVCLFVPIWKNRTGAGTPDSDDSEPTGELIDSFEGKPLTGEPGKTSRKVSTSSRSISGRHNAEPNMKSLVAQLLPRHLQEMFEYRELTALTNDDEAGLALIAELIDKRAKNLIRVIGRGPQLIDPKTKPYIRAVANAILRGVEYNRILLLDSNLPQNSLLWLLFLEGFLKSAKWRDAVHLHVIKMDSTNMAEQFQLIDTEYLHRVFRHYSTGELGASKKAQSQFAMSPDGAVAQHCTAYDCYQSEAGSKYGHSNVVGLLCDILHRLDSRRQDIVYHWKLVLAVIDFLEDLRTEGMPPRGIKFVGSLPPYTFTYQAAEKFARKAETEETISERMIVLPFRRLEDALKQFIGGRLDYVCVPIANSQVDNLIPPTVTESIFDQLKRDFRAVDEEELPVKFVLAGIYQEPTMWRRLVAVEAAYLQVHKELPEGACALPRYDEEVESNYHAAWLAQNDVSLIAVTTSEAARHLNLHVYSHLLHDQRNFTKFAVYSH
jgi:hypothetical protein